MKKRLHQMEQETSTMHGGTGDETMMPSTSSSGGLLTDQGGDMSGMGGGPNMDMDGSSHVPGGVVGGGGPGSGSGGGPMIDETTADSDARSIYVGNVSLFLHTYLFLLPHPYLPTHSIILFPF